MKQPDGSAAARLALARSLDFGARAGRLQWGEVRPHWLPAPDGGPAFWYLTREAHGLAHRWVDVARRTCEPLYDAPRLFAELGRAGVAATPDRLSRLVPDLRAGTLDFDAGERRWRWDGLAMTDRGPAFGPGAVVSPDGTWAVCSPDRCNLWIHRAGDPAPVRLTHDGEADRGWGDFADFISQVARRTALQPPAPVVLWSPDCRRFAVLRVDRRHLRRRALVQASPPGQRGPAVHTYPFVTPMDPEGAPVEVWLFGVDGACVRAGIDGLECRGLSHLALSWCRWSSDGRHLDLVDADRGLTRLTLWRIDADDGRAHPLLQEVGPAVVLPGPSIAEGAVFQVLDGGDVLWWSQRSGWGHLYRVAPDGTATAVTGGDWQVRRLLHVDEAAGTLLFTASGREAGVDPYLVHAYRVGLDGGGLTLLTPEPAHHVFCHGAPVDDGACSVAPDGTLLVDSHSCVDRAPRSVVRDASGRQVMTLPHGPQLDTWPPELPLPEPFHVPWPAAPDAASTDLWGVLHRPAWFDPDRRYPVVELIYGAPQAAVVPKDWTNPRFGAMAEQLAALGFVVVCLDGPGTPYRSRAFQLHSHGRIEVCGGLPMHAAAIRSLASDRPWMDLSRVGIVGASGGGYAVVRAMATLPELYRAGVSMCGNHDQATYVAGWGEHYHGLYGVADYDGQDNATVAAAIQGELLLIHGEMDDNVHPAATLRIADVLVQANRRFELLVVPNAGHMVALLPYVQQRIHEFLARTLGTPAPDDDPTTLPRSA